MSGLRILALSYLASASIFAVAAITVAHPDLGRLAVGGGQALARALDERVWQPLANRAHEQGMALLASSDSAPVRIDMTPSLGIELTPSDPNDVRTLARNRVLNLPSRSVEASGPEFAASASVTILPDLTPEVDVPLASQNIGPPPEPPMAAPHMPRAVAPNFRVARKVEPQAAPDAPPLFAADAGTRAQAVAARLRLSLTPEMVRNFDLFLYVSKADRGPLAQHMYVFQKQPGNVLKLLHDWPASTGREQQEVNPRGRSSFTATPRGYYELDPKRMYTRYHSYSWDQDMPNAMFFNWEREGLQTGLAIHAASGDDVARLGQRASAGCVHLSPQNARALFELIRQGYRGDVPRFAYNYRTDTMSNDGSFMHDRHGNLKMASGYKVLTFIEDYGGSDKLAALF